MCLQILIFELKMDALHDFPYSQMDTKINKKTMMMKKKRSGAYFNRKNVINLNMISYLIEAIIALLLFKKLSMRIFSTRLGNKTF